MLTAIFSKNTHIPAIVHKIGDKIATKFNNPQTHIKNFATKTKKLTARTLFVLNRKSVDCYLSLKSEILVRINRYKSATLLYSNITPNYRILERFKIKLVIFHAVVFNKDHIDY